MDDSRGGAGRHRSWRDLPPTPPLGPTSWPDAEPAPVEAPLPAAASPTRARHRRRRQAVIGAGVLGVALAVVAIGSVTGGTVGQVVGMASDGLLGRGPGASDPAGASPAADATPTPTPAPLDPADEELAATVQRMLPSVVEIQNGPGTGSGFVADKGGWILTASHVVGQAKTVTVRLSDGTTTTATVEGVDSSIDTAVLRAERTDLPPLVLGTSAGVRVGQATIAVGSPFGFSQTVTTGIVSGLDRTLPTQMGELRGLIQTDATINPGNSGGPLADRDGRVIGINTAIASQSGGSDGVGFAIPIDAAKELLRRVQSGEWTARDDRPAQDPSTLPGLDDLFGPNGPLGGQGLDDLFGPNGPLGGQGLDGLDKLFGPDGSMDPQALDQLLEELFGQRGLAPDPGPGASPAPAPTPTPGASPAPDASPAVPGGPTDPGDTFGLDDLGTWLRLFDQLFGGGMLAPGDSGLGQPTGATR